MPAVADPPHRRVGGPSKRSKETTIHQSSDPELLWPLGGCEDAKSGMAGGEPCPPIYGPSGIDGAYLGLDSRGKREVDMQIHAAGIALDRAERHAAEWGHASIASAVLVETHSQSDGFHIDAEGTYKQFADSVRKGRQGGASRLIEDTLKAKLQGTFGSDTHQGREHRIEELRQLTDFKLLQYNLEL